MSDEFLREQRDNVLVATINRPDARNALNGAVMRGLADAVIEAEGHPAIRALVIAAAGDRAFCAGMDLRMFAEGTATEVPAEFLRLMSGDVAVPVLGAVNGFAVGGGCELALACDVVVASHDASFGLPEVKRGLIPGMAVTHAVKRMPMSIALEMALSGERMDAARAYELGFVNRLVPSAEVFDTTITMAQTIAANAPLSLTAIKELIRMSAYGAAGTADRYTEWQNTILNSDDAKEGALAFVEKRAPVWQGR